MAPPPEAAGYATAGQAAVVAVSLESAPWRRVTSIRAHRVSGDGSRASRHSPTITPEPPPCLHTASFVT